MALLEIRARLDKGAGSPFLVIDQNVVQLEDEGAGSLIGRTTVAGSIGDGSMHQLLMSWTGPSGATMQVTVCCNSHTLRRTEAVAISPATAPFGGGRGLFKL
jgi:hypothetical protein